MSLPPEGAEQGSVTDAATAKFEVIAANGRGEIVVPGAGRGNTGSPKRISIDW